MNVGLSLSEVELEDHWLIRFIPSLMPVHKFLKYDNTIYQYKPYGSDIMNGYGSNLNKTLPDMLEYWNFYLTNEMITATRQKFTWLDNFAFIGGNIDFVLMGIGIFFSVYNYNVSNFKLYYQHHMTEAMQLGKKGCS